MQVKNEKRAVVFDFDGTLVNTLDALIPIVQDIAREFRLRVPSFEEIRPHWGMDGELLIRTLWPTANPDLFAERWSNYEQTRPLHCPAFPGALTTLRSLRDDRLVLALHTNRRQNLRPLLTSAGIDPSLFHCLFSTADGIPPKPDPRALGSVLARLTRVHGIVRPSSVCVVSDQASDAHMARACQCRFIGVETGASRREDFVRAWGEDILVVPSIADVPDLVLSL